MNATQAVGFEFHLRPEPRLDKWEQMLDALFAFDAQFRPVQVERLAGVGAQQQAEPWSQALKDELIRRCVSNEPSSWIAFHDLQDETGFRFSRWPYEVVLLLAIVQRAESLPDYLLALLEALQPSILPAMGLIFDRHSGDAQISMHGLRGIQWLPPMLYLDAVAARQMGGLARLQNAPCETRDMPGGGILLIADPTLIGSAEARHDVARYLGISSEEPLVLI